VVQFQGGGAWHRGVYSWSGGSITGEVLAGQARPDGQGNFTYSNPSDAQDGAFVKTDFGLAVLEEVFSPGGVYLKQGGSLSTIANEKTSVPDGFGTFAGPGASSPFAQVHASGNTLVFHARSDDTTGANQHGIYRWTADDGLSKVVDYNDTGDVQTGNFHDLQLGAVDGDRVAFTGKQSKRALYVTENGVIRQVFATHSALPESSELAATAPDSDSVSLDGDRLAFKASTGGFDFQGIYFDENGTLHRVIDSESMLGGKPIRKIEMTGDSLDGDQLAFILTHDDWSQSIYVANILEVEDFEATYWPELTPDPVAITRGTFSAEGDGSASGQLVTRYVKAPEGSEVSEVEFGFSEFEFRAAAELIELWDISLDTAFDEATITFEYDAASHYNAVVHSDLRIFHYEDGEWVIPTQTIDLEAGTITVVTESLSPFALGLVPEPGTLGLMVGGAIVLLGRRRG